MTKVDKRKKGSNPPRCHHKHLVKNFQFFSFWANFATILILHLSSWFLQSRTFYCGERFLFFSFPFFLFLLFLFPFPFSFFLFLSIPFPLTFTLLFDHHHFNCYFNSKIYDFIWYVLFSRMETGVFSCLFVSLVNQNSAILIKSILDFVDKPQIQNIWDASWFERMHPPSILQLLLVCIFLFSFSFWIWIVLEIK